MVLNINVWVFLFLWHFIRGLIIRGGLLIAAVVALRIRLDALITLARARRNLTAIFADDHVKISLLILLEFAVPDILTPTFAITDAPFIE